MELENIISYVAPVLTALIGWLFGRKKERNDFLSDLQASIDLLAEKNRLLMEEIVKLRNENAQLRYEVEELNRKLENVKTITKKA
jgi:predicted  nucleic acid-binding Zn-ribbon protein